MKLSLGVESNLTFTVLLECNIDNVSAIILSLPLNCEMLRCHNICLLTTKYCVRNLSLVLLVSITWTTAWLLHCIWMMESTQYLAHNLKAITIFIISQWVMFNLKPGIDSIGDKYTMFSKMPRHPSVTNLSLVYAAFYVW